MAEIAGGAGNPPDVLNAEQIARYAYQAGFRGQDLAIIVAIALAESRGNRLALNPNGEHSVGLWQINMDAHGTRFGTEDQLKNPYINAQAAYALYVGRGNGFEDWSVYKFDGTPGYTNGYSQFLPDATQAATTVSQQPYTGDWKDSINSGGATAVGTAPARPVPGTGGNFDPLTGRGITSPGDGVPSGFGSEGWALADTDASGTIDEDELAAHIQRTYPQVLWALDDPELGPILRQAAEESWDEARLYGALIQTNFWRSHPDRERVLINLRNNDPATYTRMVEEMSANVANIAEQIGWGTLPATRLRALTEQAMNHGWSPQQIQDAIIEAVPIDLTQIREGNVGGRIMDIYSSLDDISNDYLLSISDRERTQWIRRILNGKVDEEAFTQYIEGIAKAQFPWLADAMDRGISPRQFLTPYQNWIAQTLEVGAETVDMTRARYQNVVYDDKAQAIRTLPEVEEYIKRTFPQWHSTRQANEQYATLNENLLQTFGRIA